MARRLIGTAVTDSNGEATITYTGTGAGKLNVVAESGTFQSTPYPVTDCIVKEDSDVTASKTYNTTINDVDFYLEFTVCPPTNSATSYVVIGDSSNNIHIGDLYGNANCGLNWSGGAFSGKAISTETDTKVTVRRVGTNVTLTVGDSTYNVTGMNVTCSTLKNIIISNSGVIKGFKIYPI